MHCQAWLVASGYWDRALIFHVANERRGGIGTAMHFRRLGVRSGVADYLAFGHNSAIAIELKAEDGKQRADQKDFEHRWRGAGFDYKIVRTLEQFQAVVQAFDLFG